MTSGALQMPQKRTEDTQQPQDEACRLEMAGDVACDAELMQTQMAAFVHEELLDSAQVLGELLMALANASVDVQQKNEMLASREFHAKSCRLFGDLLMKKREFKRAIQYYKRFWKLHVGSTAAALHPDAVQVKVKMAKCWMELESPQQAVEVLKSVPAVSRTLSVNLLLGKLYLLDGLAAKAEEAYLAALQLNPYAVEASMALADIQASREASALLSSASSSNPSVVDGVANVLFWERHVERFAPAARPQSSSTISPEVDAKWLQALATAHIHTARGRYRAAMECFDAIEKVFPNNLHCLLHKGKLEMDQDFHHQAHLNFHRARQVDDLNLALMDAHADCLRKNDARVQLNNLVHDLFAISEQHVEPWLAAAYFSEMKGEYDTALQLCERAIITNRHYAPAYLFRGSLLLQMQRPDHALMAFTTSCKLNKTLEAYGGVIMSYCDLCMKGLNKYKEALTTAKTVVKLYPQKSQSYTLLGNVLALRPEHTEQARKAFQRALSMEPRKLAAVFGLVDLLVRDSHFAQAIDKLVNVAEQFAREEVFTKLADVYTLNKQYGEAMTYYHRSLSLNPASADAARGMERLEKIMRGEDPDELNTTMEHMDQDEQEDSMEAGEYGGS
ncbi:hypothetical protein Poli38472_008719 [Pythium oligandrum]|uniref:Anaphase-promoting complex subunit 7 n=1 Tax=Pythium oligandrum TaxID=41045 RepID=A0A8K1FBF6_PYTOL|nr:hypothetical protein Poli38472_008719 [Pythium oligandrum]|eukprot:TMW56071.1 hypothetical protein Poli38472_008719 [Pythium oligandrum]